jgi:hypothetical protein
VGGENTHRSEEAVDEEFTDAEIRALLKKAALDRRQAQVHQRQERAGDPNGTPENGTTTETPRETPLEQPAA